uniref:Hsp90 chaperone protein kinase-targeting subunit n=1 Tax=Phlebotomus papatasi TaxID=29031 RepID=A0A1B0CZ57_PHLPP
MEGKKELMAHVAHQCICMQYMLELSKQLDVDPRACVSMFFSRIQVADLEYKKQFEDEVESFKERIRKRAAEKLAAAAAEVEEEERLARLGPGGLDPEEVISSLPEELQKCFETRDVKLLQDTIAKMNPEEAKYHMKRCIDSGLWVPDANKGASEDEGEDIYQEASVERMEEAQKEKEAFEAKKKETEKKFKELQSKLTQDPEIVQKDPELKQELERIEREKQELKKKEDELQKKERHTPWNVDTISKPGFAKTVINTKPSRPKEEDLTDEEREQRMKDF